MKLYRIIIDLGYRFKIECISAPSMSEIEAICADRYPANIYTIL